MNVQAAITWPLKHLIYGISSHPYSKKWQQLSRNLFNSNDSRNAGLMWKQLLQLIIKAQWAQVKDKPYLTR